MFEDMGLKAGGWEMVFNVYCFVLLEILPCVKDRIVSFTPNSYVEVVTSSIPQNVIVMEI